MSFLMFARWFGIVSVILSFGILFNLENAEKMARHMVKSDSGYIMGGVLPIIFGTLCVVMADDFAFNKAMLVTAVGVCMLAVGIFRVIFVKHWQNLIERHIQYIPFLFSLFGLMLGVILLYVGFSQY